MSQRVASLRHNSRHFCLLQNRTDAVPTLANLPSPSRRGQVGRTSAVSVPREIIQSKSLHNAPQDHHRIQPAAESAGSKHLSARDLFREAQISRMSGYCYGAMESLSSLVEAEGLKLVAAGDTFFTRWYIVEGTLTGSVPEDPSIKFAQPDSPQPRDTATLHVFMRGVMWNHAEIDSAKVWSQLSQTWAIPFSPEKSDEPPNSGDSTAPSEHVTSHKGITDMAQELYEVIRLHLRSHEGPVTLAGHSLGGTFAKMLAAMLVMDGRARPEDVVCHTFGSPAAFGTSSGGHGPAVMQRLGLRNHQIRNWVLDHDPIPRAWTEANHYLQMALQVDALRSAYQWAEWAAKSVGATPVMQRLLFRNVGDVYLLTHDAAAVDGVRYVPPEDIDRVLAESPAPAAESAPFPAPQLVRQAQQMLEHAQQSYTHDLHTAARLRLRREQRDAAPGQHGNGSERAVGGDSEDVVVGSSNNNNNGGARNGSKPVSAKDVQQV